jgi:cell division transport system permease protein
MHKKTLQQKAGLHWEAILQGLAQLSRAPLATLLTCTLIGISLALPMALFVLLKNVEALSKNYQQNTQITLYLKTSTSDNEARTLLETLKHHPGISAAEAISPAEGLQELRNAAGLTGNMTELGTNPLPWAIVVLPTASYHTPKELTKLSQLLKQNPEVQSAQLDSQWAERLTAILKLAHRCVYTLATLLAIGVLLIIHQCIGTATLCNRKEIRASSALGGTHPLTRWPFLYAGMIYGLLGSILAWQLVDLMLMLLRGPADALAQLYQSPFHLVGIGCSDTFSLLFISISLGLTGAWLAVARYS